jgi:hypothetical protein
VKFSNSKFTGFNARPVVYILYGKPLADNIYKQWERVMVIRIDTEIWEIGEGGTKRGTGKGVDGWRKQ